MFSWVSSWWTNPSVTTPADTTTTPVVPTPTPPMNTVTESSPAHHGQHAQHASHLTYENAQEPWAGDVKEPDLPVPKAECNESFPPLETKSSAVGPEPTLQPVLVPQPVVAHAQPIALEEQHEQPMKKLKSYANVARANQPIPANRIQKHHQKGKQSRMFRMIMQPK